MLMKPLKGQEIKGEQKDMRASLSEDEVLAPCMPSHRDQLKGIYSEAKVEEEGMHSSIKGER